MAKTILGVDIGHDQLKLALVKGQTVLKTAYADMPENLLRDGRITSRESMGELIRHTMKENGMRANRAAFVLPNETVYVKNVTVPQMTIQQLEYNLPYEFNDYITGELKDYIFDYAVISDPKQDAASEDAAPEGETDGEERGPSMELMAVGALRAVVEDAQEVLRKAGLRMEIAAPTLCAYISLIRASQEKLLETAEEYAVLDLGYRSVRMYMFKGDRHVATRVLEIGLSSVESVIADAYSVDVHLARTYMRTNFEECLQRAECLTAYENIAVELMRAMNFYHFSNPDSTLADMWLCGGGAVIRPLRESISEMLGIQVHPGDELVPGGANVEDCDSFVQAIGITMG